MRIDTALHTPPQAAYDPVADEYDHLVRTGALIHELVLPPLLGCLGELKHKRVLDLACGQGVVARELVRRGAKLVVGVDTSAQLLEIATRYGMPPSLFYLREDAQHLSLVPNGYFDVVVCNMALSDIPNLKAVARAVARVLHEGGVFALALPHMCFQTPDSCWSEQNGTIQARIGGYYQEGHWLPTTPGKFAALVGGAYHRTLSTYLNTLTSAGLLLMETIEPRPTGALAERKPGYAEVAGAIIFRLVKCSMALDGAHAA